jgi:HEAT repeat protein
VTIRASSSKQIDALIADLRSGSAVARETAVARLTVLGPRAVERLLATAGTDADANTRAGAWRALEAIGDTRAVEPALSALAAPGLDAVTAVSAVGVARAHLGGAQGPAVLDRLATVLLDRDRDEAVRLAALRALRDLDTATIAPILKALAGDRSAAVRAEAGLNGADAARAAEDPAALVTRAAEGRLPEEPGPLRYAVSRAGKSAALPLLLKIVERVREREGSETGAARDDWRLTRAAAHVALASRRSRLALYDLRESLETARSPLPVEFLTALSMIGDASCVEAIAGAYAKAKPKDAWWREQLARVFREIVAREKMTRRHAALKRIEKRWPGVLQDMPF